MFCTYKSVTTLAVICYYFVIMTSTFIYFNIYIYIELI